MAEVRHASAENRFEIWCDGVLAGIAEYKDSGGTRSFLHTQIDPAFEGRGLASELIRTALDESRDNGLDVLPFCPFVKDLIARLREYVDLVPVGHRARFDLEEPLDEQ